METPKRFVLAQIGSISWAPNFGPRPGWLVFDGGGYRVYPDAAAPGDPIGGAVDVVVSVVPGVQGISLELLDYIVDDPSDDNGPLDNDSDADHFNQPDNAGGPGVLWDYQLTTTANGSARTGFEPGVQPGDNYRVAVAGRFSDLLPVKPFDPLPVVPNAPGTSLLFHDRDGDNVFDQVAPADEFLDENNSSAGVKVTPLLTTWRKLHVEVDSMGAGGTVFPDDGIATDVNLGDIPAPDTSLLQGAFGPAFITVVVGTPHDEPDVDFEYHVSSSASASRGIGESPSYWAAYVIGAYEPVKSFDFDPDLEAYHNAETYTAEPEYSFIYFEVQRDIAAFYGWNATLIEQQTVAHEIGHQFGLPNRAAGGGLMVQDPNPTIRTSDFIKEDLKLIREVAFP